MAPPQTAAARRRQHENENQVWEEFDGVPDPNFFDDITIAKDGGFSEVKDLWYPMRWLTAVITVFFLLSNLYYTLYVDYKVLRHKSAKQALLSGVIGEAIVTQCICKPLGLEPPSNPGVKFIAGTELFLTVWRLLSAAWHSLNAKFSRNESDRWISAEQVWWQLIPDLYTYSAMRLLHHVSPQVFVSDLSLVFKTSSKTWIAIFIVRRLACLFIGFDSFLMKCREAAAFINADDDEIVDPWVLYTGILFLKQVLGIVQLGMFVRDRLFVFIFAGEDSIMQPREEAKKKVWNAMLVRKIWRSFSYARASAIMLSFDDGDFQKLVMNETFKQGPKALDTYSSEEDESESSDP